MKWRGLERRHISGSVFLLICALLVVALINGPISDRIEARRQIEQHEKLVQARKQVASRGADLQARLSEMTGRAEWQRKLLQGQSSNMATTNAQAILSRMIDKNGGRVLRAANARTETRSGLLEIVTSVHFECSGQDLDDILYRIEFGDLKFVIDRADIRTRKRAKRVSREKAGSQPSLLMVRLDVRGFWQEP